MSSSSIFQKLLPRRYGGKWNRYYRFQKLMAKKRWFEKDTMKNGPITLFDFQNSIHDQVDAAMVCETIKNDGWRISDDGVIGGNSAAKFLLVRTPIDYQRVATQQQQQQHDDNNNNEPKPFLDDIDQIVAEQREKEEELRQQQIRIIEEEEERASNDNKDETTVSSSSTSYASTTTLTDDEDNNNQFIPFVRWKGTLDTQITKTQEERGIKRTGFCAIRSPEFTPFPANLDGRYNGIEIMCRSDGRPYSVNLHLETFIPDDIYQCFINIPPTVENTNDNNRNNSDIMIKKTTTTSTGGQQQENDELLRFDKVVLLFHDFIVTSKGRLRATHRELDTNIKIESIGFTLMDGCDGNFQFDLARIRAVNFDERGVIGEAD